MVLLRKPAFFMHLSSLREFQIGKQMQSKNHRSNIHWQGIKAKPDILQVEGKSPP
jgi:hypothetical protein